MSQAIKKGRPAKRFKEETKEYKPRLQGWFDSCKTICHSHARSLVAMIYDASPEIQEEVLDALVQGAEQMKDVISGVCRLFKKDNLTDLLSLTANYCLVDALLEDIIKYSSKIRDVIRYLVDSTNLEEGDISANDDCDRFH
jgi:hypothetical protein